jgi:hypothetical protein
MTIYDYRYWAGVDLDAPALFKFKPRRAKMTAPPGIVEVDPDMKMVSSTALILTFNSTRLYAITVTTTAVTADTSRNAAVVILVRKQLLLLLL